MRQINHDRVLSRAQRRMMLIGILGLFASMTGLHEARAQDAVSLQLKWLHQFQFAGYYQALEQGYYRDAGFDVELREGGPNIDPAADVASGKADFGVCTSGILLRSPADPKLISLAVVFQHSAAVILTTRVSGITNVAQIAGRPFMDTPGSDELAAMLKRVGVDYAALPRVAHDGDPRDLLSGKADAMVAYSTNEPFVLEEMGEPYHAFSPRAVGIDFYGDILCASERRIAQNPERAAAFRAASLKGWQYALANKEATVDLILRRYSDKKKREALLFEANETDALVQPNLVELGYQNPERWQRIAQSYQDLGMMTAAVVPQGMIFGLAQAGIPQWLKYSLAGLLAFGALASAILSRISALNRRLKSENVERKRMETELQDALTQAEAERGRARTIIDSSPDPAIIVRRDGTIDYVNRQGVAMLGFTPEELIGASVERLVPAAARARHPGHMRDFFAAGQARQMGSNRELTVVTKSLREIPVEISLSPMDYRGERMVIVSLRDVTENKRLQREIKDALSDAKAERTRTDAILAGAPDPIIIVRSDSKIEYVNDQVTRILGYAASELIGQSLEILIPKRYLTGHGSQVRGFFEAGQVRFMGAGRELFARTKSGQEIPVAIALSPVKAGDRSVVVAAIRDVTDQKEAEKAVREARDAAEAATKAKSDFLASMSHEIRTPMNGITGMADVLAQTSLDDEQKHMLRTIRESGNALITVINDILDFSKIEAGKLDLETVSMSIVDAVEGVAATLTPNAVKKGVRIHVFVDPQLPAAVRGDPTRLRQILFNLGGNAVKFSDGKDVQIRAVPSARSDDGRTWVRFDLIDSGIGISKENQAKLFQAFSQAETSTTRKFGGTGLGLAICKRLTEMMGGLIGVDSREGHGSTFWVELPFQEIEGVKPRQKERDLHGLRVLLVGSQGPRGEAIAAYIRHWGAEVTTATDLDDALAVLTSGGGAAFDSIVLDLGLDTARQEKAMAALRRSVAKNTMIVLQDYQHRGARIIDKDVVSIDVNPLVRYRIITAVAVAAGRASPEIKTEDDAARLKPSKAPTVEEALARGQLILLAEDNLTNQDVIRRQLNLIGYTCEIVNNGAEALNAYRTGRHALLLTDCHMPEMDGYELTGKIREHERGSGQRLPIIAVTANALQGEAERCLAAGMDDYVSKPIVMPALVAALKKWMPASGMSTEQKPEADTGVAPAQASNKPQDAVIDERAIKDVFGDDEETFKEILQSFAEPSRDIIADMLSACDGRDAPGVKDAAHKLKSSARTVGAHALADTCLALETAGKTADWDTIKKLTPVARAQFEAVAAYVSSL